MKFYFTSDGAYGLADDYTTVIDTSGWSDEDWEQIENCSDSKRFELAKGKK